MTVPPTYLQDGVRGFEAQSYPPNSMSRDDRDDPLRTLVTMNSDGLLVVGRDDGVVRFANPAAAALLGRSPERLRGQTFGTPVIPGETTDIDILRANGEHCVAELRTAAIDWDGVPSYLVALRDVTEQRRARQACLDLLERERAHRQAAEAAEGRAAFLADAGALLGPSPDYESALAALARFAVPFLADWCAVHLRDGDRVRLVGLAGTALDRPITAEDVQQCYTLDLSAEHGVARVLRTGVTEILPAIGEPLLHETAGSPKQVRTLQALELGSSLIVPMTLRGQTLGTLAFARSGPDRAYGPAERALAEDLGRRAAAAVDNGRAYRRLADADRRQDEFLAMLAHELRNPLAPLRNALYMLRQHGHPAPAEWAWEVANRQVRHLGRVVDGLLDVSRVTRGRVKLQREAVDLAALARRAVDAAHPLFEARQHHCRLHLPDDPLFVEADPLRLEQVLANLLDNAARYTGPGGRIDVAVRGEGGAAVVEVKDNGLGIDPHVLPRVFNLFEQGERPLDRSQGGLGIGLTLAQRLVELHGGSIEAASAGPGQGSTFTIRLPARGAAPDEPAALPAPLPKGRRVLVVDDNRDLAESLAMVLRLWGHDVRVAYDGRAALEAARAQPPEVVFLDIGLPHLDGFEVARRMREHPELKGARIVAVTGYGCDEDRKRSQEAGFDVHLTKPVDPSDLHLLLADGDSRS
jgi:signal transduction histidine kinase